MLSEIAIVSTDIAELIGSAIGLCLIFPSIPLWVSVLITASDILIFLLVGDPSRGNGKPVKVFEYVVMTLVCSPFPRSPSVIFIEVWQVAAVFVCFLVLLVKVNPAWADTFLGYVPDKSLFQRQPDALYTGDWLCIY